MEPKKIMNKAKHHKIKNTGILFELLTRQITADILNSNDKSKAIGIIKRFFGHGTELRKELVLYNSLVNEKLNSEHKANQLIDVVLTSRQRLNESKLKTEKYDLVKEIGDSYNIKEFFRTPLNNYKVLASVFQLFEYSANNLNESVSPISLVNARYTVVEFITGNSVETPGSTADAADNDESLLEEYKKEDKDTRLLSYKYLVDKFNAKYDGLDDKQKKLLKEYINNISNTNSLREYMLAEIPGIKAQLADLSTKVDDKVTLIKLNEVTNQLDNLCSTKVVKDNQVLSLLKYYELVKELYIANGESK